MLSAAPTPFDPAITINEIHIPDPSVKNTYDEKRRITYQTVFTVAHR